MATTAKMKLIRKGEVSNDQVVLEFNADYEDGRNKEWSKYTPAASFTMCVVPQVADNFEQGKGYLFTIEEATD